MACRQFRKEIPALGALSRDFGSEGFVVLGVTAGNPAKARDFVGRNVYGEPLGDKVKMAFVLDHGGIQKS